MKKIRLHNILLACTLSAFTFSASAEWILNNAESTLNVTSIKKLKVGEVHSFKKLQGSLDDKGNVTLMVNLASVETNIPIRNDRMQQFLFEVPKFSEATVSTKINIEKITKMKVGESLIQTLPLELSIHGSKKVVDAEMRITSLVGNTLLVSTIKPMIINASDYALVKGIEKLTELAKLPSISTAIPVTASFIFENKK